MLSSAGGLSLHLSEMGYLREKKKQRRQQRSERKGEGGQKTLNMFNDVQLTVGEAKTALRVEKDHSVSAVVVVALEMAIEALDEYDEDAISRNNAITSICWMGTTLERAGINTLTVSEMKKKCADLLKELPAVRPKAKSEEDEEGGEV